MPYGNGGGINALYQKCPHLGCRVPELPTSQWFECPCHGSQYNQVGEKRGARARAAWTVPGRHQRRRRDRRHRPIFLGPPIGTNTTGQEAEGPHCITGGE
jgi:cytochrome b6-f complex iron-sulfur subunit